MHYPVVYTLLAGVVGSLVSAQDLSQIPQCAQEAALSSIGSTGCQITDFACICKDQAFLNSLLPVVQKNCSPADLQKIISFTQTLCLSVSVTLTLPTIASTTAAPTSASTAAVPITSASTSAPSGTASSGTASAASTLSSTAGTKTTSGSQSQTPTGATTSSTPSATVSTANSASRFASAGGFMAAIAVAVAVVGWS